MNLVSQRLARISGRCCIPDNGRFSHDSRVSRSHDQRSTKPAVVSCRDRRHSPGAQAPTHTHHPPKSHAAEPRNPGRGNEANTGTSWKLSLPTLYWWPTGEPVQLVKEKRGGSFCPGSYRTERVAAQAAIADPASFVVMSFMNVLYPQGRLWEVQPADLGMP